MQVPIFMDTHHRHGFLHRLDVPSSGLILAAKTYEAFYDLQVQLCAGKMAREYTVLAHGWVPRSLREIMAHTNWRGEEATIAGGRGKPSYTTFAAAAYGLHEVGSVSGLAVRILTGRRHQIRIHLSHVGHPALHDGLYTSSASYECDAALCPRNSLHRHRLAFMDVRHIAREAIAPLPPDLVHAFQQLRSRNQLSASPLEACSRELN
eukprot:TRINITY_DN49255_c0_g1_i1.p1 TRINITY_DN49255_c0_g1~~TRINITY_DN49255_c0_g1_i1.p1  ORF type:complete len:207 (+),score=25.15 TRINITY_DN49255_c0_g1_i1:146-766(+)